MFQPRYSRPNVKPELASEQGETGGVVASGEGRRAFRLRRGPLHTPNGGDLLRRDESAFAWSYGATRERGRKRRKVRRTVVAANWRSPVIINYADGRSL